ncbi:MAG: type II secretion system F family protein [Firmicutes bacterium]|nr:type II secretion system F family protein [Bacillota bacterium]
MSIPKINLNKINSRLFQFILICFFISLLYFILLTENIIFAFIISCLTIFLVPYFQRLIIKRTKYRMIIEFQDFIYLLNGSLQGGNSYDNALVETKFNLFSMYGDDTLLGKELEKIIYWNKIGIGYEKGFLMLEEEYKIGFFKEFSTVLNITRNKGGNFKEVLEQTNNTLSERLEIEREIGTLLAKQRIEVLMLRVIPFIMMLGLKFIYPEMIIFLTTSILGGITFFGVGLIFALSFYISNKLMEVVWD